jgi:hypothetical protein
VGHPIGGRVVHGGESRKSLKTVDKAIGKIGLSRKLDASLEVLLTAARTGGREVANARPRLHAVIR